MWGILVKDFCHHFNWAKISNRLAAHDDEEAHDWMANCALALRMRTLLKGTLNCFGAKKCNCNRLKARKNKYRSGYLSFLITYFLKSLEISSKYNSKEFYNLYFAYFRNKIYLCERTCRVLKLRHYLCTIFNYCLKNSQSQGLPVLNHFKTYTKKNEKMHHHFL